MASDIVLPDILDHSPYVGETSLDYPLPWDTIDAAEFNKLNRVQPYLAGLRSFSAARLATNQDFAYIKQDINEFEKLDDDRTATINEDESINERKRIFAENRARERERQSRPVPGAKIYELTIQNCDDPGLPAPMSYFMTNLVATAYQGNPPIIYYSSDTNFFALPGKVVNVFTLGTNVVATMTNDLNSTDIKLPANFTALSGLSQTGNMLSVTNPVELDRIPPDAALDETKQILQDYITLLSNNSMQIVSH